MRSAKKTVIYAVCGLLVAATAVFATLAYLWDQDAVVNTFTVGNVAITLDETDVDEYGKAIDADGDGKADSRTNANTYRLIPGYTYTKDPMVTVDKSSEKAYVRMLVTVSDIADLEAALGEFLPGNYVKDWDKDVWLYEGVTDNGDNTRTYEFRYYKVVDPKENKFLEPLFTSFTAPGELDADKLQSLAELEINVVAHAIQADGFDDADAAWTAFENEAKN